jgi:hypothetical protein
MVDSILNALRRIKADVAAHLEAAVIERLCTQVHLARTHARSSHHDPRLFVAGAARQHGLRSCVSSDGQAIQRGSL